MKVERSSLERALLLLIVSKVNISAIVNQLKPIKNRWSKYVLKYFLNENVSDTLMKQHEPHTLFLGYLKNL